MGLFWRRPKPTMLWALDLELDGLDVKRSEILSVGMVPVRGGVVRLGEAWASLVKPTRLAELSEEAIRIHHLVPADLSSAPPIADVVPEIDRRLREGALLVHHSGVDVPFLRRVFSECGQRFPEPVVIDTFDLIHRLERRRQLIDPHARELPRNLSAIREELRLPPYPAHDALSDAIATAELYLVLTAMLG